LDAYYAQTNALSRPDGRANGALIDVASDDIQQSQYAK